MSGVKVVILLFFFVIPSTARVGTILSSIASNLQPRDHYRDFFFLLDLILSGLDLKSIGFNPVVELSV